MTGGTFWDLVERAAADRPGDVVLSDDHGRSLTTAGLRDTAAAVAAGLVERGLDGSGAEAVVSWQLPTSLEAAVLLAACARLGLTQNPIIPILREREVSFIVRQAGTSLLVVPTSWRGFDHGAMARKLGPAVLDIDFEATPAGGVRLPLGDVGALPAPPVPHDGCRWIYYTSGTTAEPKGVRHSDSSTIASSNGIVHQLGIAEGDVYPIAWPFAHIGGISMLAGVLRAGGSLVLFDHFDPQETPERMAAHAPTILGSATPFFHAYIAAQRRHGAEKLFPRLRACVAGGAPTPESVSRETAEVLGVAGVTGAWGLTEFPVASSETPRDPAIGTSSGTLAEGVEARVVDGELRLRGPQCFLGYVDSSLDADAFDAEGWLRTGDLGSIDGDGRVHISGRLKDVIIRNAENISALEVEEVLLRHPQVADVAVVGLPDAGTGESVCAFVVLRPGAEAGPASLVEHCSEQGLARYKWPTDVRFVDALPRNSMGKILKNELREGAAG